MENLADILLSSKLWGSVIAAFVYVIFWLGLNHYRKKFMKNHEDIKASNLIRFGFSVARVVSTLIVVVVILQINGINVSSLVTGLGVVGVVVAFALQDILKDLMMGVAIIWDRYFAVGDRVRIGEIEGKVIDFNMKTTKLLNLANSNIVTISNRNITQVEILSDWMDVLIPVDYDADVKLVRETLSEIATKSTSNELIISCDFLGTDQFADSAVMYRMRLHALAEDKGPAKRFLFGMIQDVFAEKGISIPFNQIVVHQG